MIPMCFGRPPNPEKKRSDRIEKQLRVDKKTSEKEIKFILLGAGESGKSTVLKQMRIINASGFNKADRKHWRAILFNNLIEAFQTMFLAMREYETVFEDPKNLEYSKMVSREDNPELGLDEPMPAELLPAFLSLWNDKGIQAAMQKGNEYSLHDNLSYFFEDFERLFDSTYLPSDQDILRTRLRTTGISEAAFSVDNFTYRMVDVGGQRSERKKWIHAFDNVNVVLFIVAISAYDYVLMEDRNTNQMHESLMLYEDIANSVYFENASLILFLNKIDLFREKIASGTAPIRRYFPDYAGADDDVEAGQHFFAKKFQNVVRDKRRFIYVHYTNATDTDLLKKTMRSVQDLVVQKRLNSMFRGPDAPPMQGGKLI